MNVKRVHRSIIGIDVPIYAIDDEKRAYRLVCSFCNIVDTHNLHVITVRSMVNQSMGALFKSCFYDKNTRVDH